MTKENRDNQWVKVCESNMRIHWSEKLREKAQRIGKMAGMSEVDIEEDLLPHLVDVAMEACGGPRMPVRGPHLARVINSEGEAVDVYLQGPEGLTAQETAKLAAGIWKRCPELQMTSPLSEWCL